MKRKPLAGFKPMTRLLASFLTSAMFLGIVRADPIDADDENLQAMCNRGLAECAIRYATAQRELAIRNGDQYARWTRRIVECEAQAALRGETTADLHWNRCRETIDQFRREQAANRRLPWLIWQSIRCDLLQAQDQLARWLAAPADQNLKQQTLMRVRSILARLDELEGDLKTRQPLAAKQGPNDNTHAPAEQLSQLRLDVVLMRCETLLIRSRLYESGSRDRVGAATNVDVEAGGILDRTSKEWPTRASLEVARATAWLELNKRQEAIEILQSVALTAEDSKARIRAAVIASEALISQGQPSRSRAFVDLLKNLEGGPEWEMADIRLLLCEVAKLPTERKETEIASLLRRAKTVGERYGDYWRSRAESILTSSISSDQMSSTTAAELVTVEVRQLLAAGDEVAAIEKLLATSRNERASARNENAIRFATQAAALLQRQKKWLAAADALEELTHDAPQTSGAPEAHLSAAWNVSQAIKYDPQNAKLNQRYSNILQDQIRLWPNSSTHDQATAWLRNWLSISGRQDELLPIFRQQAEQSLAPEKCREALYAWLTVVLSSAEKRQTEIGAMQHSLEDGKLKIGGFSTRVVLLMAKLVPEWLEPNDAARLHAEAVELKRSLEAPTDRQFLGTFYLLEAARSGDAALATKMASQWKTTDLPIEVIEPLIAAIIDSVDAWPANEQPTQQRPHKEWPSLKQPEWSTKVTITDEQLQALEQSARLTSQALALRWRGLQAEQAGRSIEGLRALCKQNSRLGVLQLHLAHSLAKQDAVARKESTDIAKRVAANSPKSSDLYYGARWLVIHNQMSDGHVNEGEKAAKLVLATMANESRNWRVRFSGFVKK